MSKLLPKDELDAHVAQFEGVPSERKQQITEHLSALPDHLHDPVHDVLVDDAPEDAEGKFIVGCFVPPGPLPRRYSEQEVGSMLAEDAAEHPNLPPAA